MWPSSRNRFSGRRSSRLREHDRQADRMPPVEGGRLRVDPRQRWGLVGHAANLEPAEQDAVALRAPGERARAIHLEEAGEPLAIGIERPRPPVGDERDGL